MSLVKFLMGKGLSRSLFSSSSSSSTFHLPTSSSQRFFSTTTTSRLALPKAQTPEGPKKTKAKKTPAPDLVSETKAKTTSKVETKEETTTSTKTPKKSKANTTSKAKTPSPGRPQSSKVSLSSSSKLPLGEDKRQEEGEEDQNTLKRQIGKASRSLVSEGVKEKAVNSLIARTVLSPSHPREDLYDLPPPPPSSSDPNDPQGEEEDQEEEGPKERKGKRRVEKEVKRQKVTEGTVVSGQSLADRIEALVKGVPGHVLELEMQRVKSTLSARSHGRPIPLAALSPSSRDSLALRARLEALSPPRVKKGKEEEEEGLEEVVYSKGMAVAYMVHQMPVTFGVLRAVFHTLDCLLPDFAPRSLLDFGSGTGSALWAARDVWGPSQLVHSVLIEPSSEMSSLADRLLHNHNLVRTPPSSVSSILSSSLVISP